MQLQRKCKIITIQSFRVIYIYKKLLFSFFQSFSVTGRLREDTCKHRDKTRYWRPYQEDRTLRTRYSMQGTKVRQNEKLRIFFGNRIVGRVGQDFLRGVNVRNGDVFVTIKQNTKAIYKNELAPKKFSDVRFCRNCFVSFALTNFSPLFIFCLCS